MRRAACEANRVQRETDAEAVRVALEAERAKEAARAEEAERVRRDKAAEAQNRRDEHVAHFGNLDTETLIVELDKLTTRGRFRECVNDIFEPRGLQISWDRLASLDSDKTWVFAMFRAVGAKTDKIGAVRDAWAVVRYEEREAA